MPGKALPGAAESIDQASAAADKATADDAEKDEPLEKEAMKMIITEALAPTLLKWWMAVQEERKRLGVQE